MTNQKGPILPDGSSFFTASFPLPETHWIYESNIRPPMPLRMASDERHKWHDKVREAIKYAIRGATMCGKENDFDPDALVQNALVGLFGYHTEDGLTDDDWANPKEIPPLVKIIDAIAPAPATCPGWRETIEQLRDALKPFVEACRKAEISGRPPFEFCGANDYEAAREALAAAPLPPSPAEDAGWREKERALADAVWQALDDMGKEGDAVCGATKAMLRHAYEPYNTDPDPDAAPDYSLAEAVEVLRSVDLLPAPPPHEQGEK